MRFFAVVIGALALIYLLDLALVSRVHRDWWARGWVRRLALAVPAVAAAAVALWALGYAVDRPLLVTVGAGGASILFVQLVALLLALTVTAPLALAARLASSLAGRWRSPGATVPLPQPAPAPESLVAEGQTPARPDRRRFLLRALAAVPLASATTAGAGVLRSTARPGLPEVRLAYPQLPADLRGLRVLQLSDLHVGPYVDLDDIADLLARAGAQAPDLVVVTGDVCDHMPAYLDTLRLVEQLRPRLGVFASLGNHEYFRGIDAVRRAFERTSIRLLVDAGLTVPVGAARLRLAGADDPRFMGDPAAPARLRASVERSLDGADGDAFHLLLSHRSQAFDTAAGLGVHLTLAGHTHGFQLGLGGRSLFERWFPRHYIWGHYGGGATQLYTTAGVGHWFPFRLGCPAEAPLFILEAS